MNTKNNLQIGKDGTLDHISDTSVNTTTKINNTLMHVLMALGIILLSIILFVINKSSKPESTSFKEVAPIVTTVVTTTVNAGSHEPILKSTASVIAWQESQLATQVAGRLEWLCDCLETGTEVKKGTVLARIEAVDYRVNVAQAKQALADAMQRIAEEQARADQARADWIDLNLGEPTDLALRKPQLETANATLERRILELQQAERNLARTRIKAPYDGVITLRSTNVGNFVGVGNSIGTILNTKKAQVNFALSADDVNKLDTDKIAIKIFDSNNTNLSWDATIVRIDSIIDPKTRLVTVIAEVDEPFNTIKHGAPLRVGSFVRTEFPGKTFTNVFALPGSAILSDNTVYSVNSDNKIEIHPVKVLHRNSDTVLVTFKDFQNDSISVITSGQSALTSGQTVSASDLD